MKNEMSLEHYFHGTATVGERGQVVIPAEARKKLNINPGDKVLVIEHPGHSGIMLCKLDAMRDLFTTLLSDLEKFEMAVVENGERGEVPA